MADDLRVERRDGVVRDRNVDVGAVADAERRVRDGKDAPHPFETRFEGCLGGGRRALFLGLKPDRKHAGSARRAGRLWCRARGGTEARHADETRPAARDIEHARSAGGGRHLRRGAELQERSTSTEHARPAALLGDELESLARKLRVLADVHELRASELRRVERDGLCRGARRTRQLEELLGLEPGVRVEARIEQAILYGRNVDGGVDEALVAAASRPHARAPLADHQRADETAAFDDELSVGDGSGSAREIDDLVAIRRALDLAEAAEVEIEKARREVVDTRVVVGAASGHVLAGDAALMARRFPELELFARDHRHVAGCPNVRDVRGEPPIGDERAVFGECYAAPLEKFGRSDDAERRGDETALERAALLRDDGRDGTVVTRPRRDDRVAEHDIDSRLPQARRE